MAFRQALETLDVFDGDWRRLVAGLEVLELDTELSQTVRIG